METLKSHLSRVCDAAKETPELSPEEDSRVRRAGEKKPYDVAELLPPARVATSGGVSTGNSLMKLFLCPLSLILESCAGCVVL